MTTWVFNIYYNNFYAFTSNDEQRSLIKILYVTSDFPRTIQLLLMLFKIITRSNDVKLLKRSRPYWNVKWFAIAYLLQLLCMVTYITKLCFPVDLENYIGNFFVILSKFCTSVVYFRYLKWWKLKLSWFTNNT